MFWLSERLQIYKFAIKFAALGLVIIYFRAISHFYVKGKLPWKFQVHRSSGTLLKSATRLLQSSEFREMDIFSTLCGMSDFSKIMQRVNQIETSRCSIRGIKNTTPVYDKDTKKYYFQYFKLLMNKYFTRSNMYSRVDVVIQDDFTQK